MKNEQRYRDSFRKFDVDPTEGKITAAGLKIILERDYDLHLTLKFAQNLVNKYAPESNGYLNEDQFVKVIKNRFDRRINDNDGEYRKLFKIFDTDGNGFIDEKELQVGMQILTTVGGVKIRIL